MLFSNWFSVHQCLSNCLKIKRPKILDRFLNAKKQNKQTKQRVDSFSTYAYSCCIYPALGFFIVLNRLKNNKQFQRTNAIAIRVLWCKWDVKCEPVTFLVLDGVWLYVRSFIWHSVSTCYSARAQLFVTSEQKRCFAIKTSEDLWGRRNVCG